MDPIRKPFTFVDSNPEYIDTSLNGKKNQEGGVESILGQKRKRENEDDKQNQNQLQIRFQCECTKTISELKEVPDHLKVCQPGLQKYGPFVQSLNINVSQAIESENITDWKNIRTFYEFFREKLLDGIQVQRESKRRKINDNQELIVPHEQGKLGFVNELTPNRKEQLERLDGLNLEGGQENHDNKMVVDAEFKQEVFVGSQKQDQNMMEVLSQDFQQQRLPADEGLNCAGCGNIYFEKDLFQIVFLENCCHIACKDCLQKAIKESYPDVKCVKEDCDQMVNDFEVKGIIGVQEYEQLQKECIDKALTGSKNLVKCNCGNYIEVLKGEIYYDYKKDDGSMINKTAARHMSQYRVRCPECGNNFCSSCRTEPYHVGFNCSQYEKHKNQRKCRFCQANLKANNKLTYCSKRQCKWQAQLCCAQYLGCGHSCYGIGHEQQHPACLHEECVAKDESQTLGENADSFCVICYVQGLGEKPVLQLECKHIFHNECIMNRIYRKWGNLAISFQYAHCPSCNQWINVPGNQNVSTWIQQAKDLEQKILEKCVLRAKHEGLDLDERLSDPKSEYYNNLQKFAYEHLNYYQCWRCQNPFFGGLRQCGENQNIQQLQQQNPGVQFNFNQNDLVCPKCRFEDQNNNYGISYCEEHKDQYIQYKCNYCCNVAAYHCGGANYYCMYCHDRKGPVGPKCKGPDDCPLKMEHPPNGQAKAFAVGCGMCKELKIGQDLQQSVGDQMKEFKAKMAKIKAELVDF